MSNVMDVGGKRFVALRSTIEEMGGKVAWDNSQKQATIDLNGKNTVVTMADENAEFDGKVLTLSGAPMVHDGTLYVPEDFFPAILSTQLPF
ncbi:MAG: copper amine oxidase N-terminal domain-containing protein [Chlorobia bacterium]|nr:copper amine oxidase N-terminal domain-containing protein [Fimbriimonadaceae bacterium]